MIHTETGVLGYMTKTDYESLSVEELSEIIAAATSAMETAKQRQREAALIALEKTALDHGFELSELVKATPAQKKERKRVPPKYRHPENPDLTWTGRGRKPKWVEELSDGDTGLTLEQCLITDPQAETTPD